MKSEGTEEKDLAQVNGSLLRKQHLGNLSILGDSAEYRHISIYFSSIKN